MMTTNDTIEHKTFTPQDRCDRCGARAYHQAENSNMLILLFCNHHMRESIDKLTRDSWIIISDELPTADAVASLKD